MTQNRTIGREAPGKAKEEDVAKPKEDAFRVRKAPPDFQGVPTLPLLHQSSSPFLSLMRDVSSQIIHLFIVGSFDLRLVSREHRGLSRHSNHTSLRKKSSTSKSESSCRRCHVSDAPRRRPSRATKKSSLRKRSTARTS